MYGTVTLFWAKILFFIDYTYIYYYQKINFNKKEKNTQEVDLGKN